jgi:hypothetical protein
MGFFDAPSPGVTGHPGFFKAIKFFFAENSRETLPESWGLSELT